MKYAKCGANWKQYKAGFNPSGSQRYRCGGCNRVYTLQATQPYCCNKRQLMKRLYPKYSFHLIDFTCPLS